MAEPMTDERLAHARRMTNLASWQPQFDGTVLVEVGRELLAEVDRLLDACKFYSVIIDELNEHCGMLIYERSSTIDALASLVEALGRDGIGHQAGPVSDAVTAARKLLKEEGDR